MTFGLLGGDFIFDAVPVLYAAKNRCQFFQGTIRTYKTRCSGLCICICFKFLQQVSPRRANLNFMTSDEVITNVKK